MRDKETNATLCKSWFSHFLFPWVRHIRTVRNRKSEKGFFLTFCQRDSARKTL